jgi:hypothetical protein
MIDLGTWMNGTVLASHEQPAGAWRQLLTLQQVRACPQTNTNSFWDFLDQAFSQIVIDAHHHHSSVFVCPETRHADRSQLVLTFAFTSLSVA